LLKISVVKALMTASLLCALLAIAGCGGGSSDEATAGATEASAPIKAGGDAASDRTQPEVIVPEDDPPGRLVVNDLIEGTGAEAKPGDEVFVNYVAAGYESGEEFDASWGEQFWYRVGAGYVLTGWDRGTEGMKVGGRRELIIPPELAYGERGLSPVVEPDETVIFVVDLLEVR
jgi:peptidylprolyl isomerase